MPDYPQADAGATIRQRRIALGFTSMEAFAEAAGSSSRMVADAERGIPVGEKTRIRLSRAAKWTDDSIDRLYRGEAPIERDQVTVRTKPADEPPLDGEIGILTARMAQLRKKLDLIPDVWDEHGPEAARAAIANLSGQMSELQGQIAQAEADSRETASGQAS